MKKLNIIRGLMIMTTVSAMIIGGCASSSKLSSAKSGAQLWGENCIRCHNAPSPDTFSDQQWDVAVSHMRVRALITTEETDKIVEFLKSAN